MVKGSDVRPIRAMKFFVSPGVHIVIQCKVASGLPQLVEGSKCLAKSDPMVFCAIGKPWEASLMALVNSTWRSV